MLSRTGRAFDVKASPDGRWVGWIEGQVIPYPDRDRPLTPNDGYPKVPTFFPAALVLLGHGAVRRIVPHQLYDVVWRFVPDRNAVAVGSAGSHGRLFLQLFDLRTGKLLASGTNNTVPLPPWSRGLIRDDTLVPGR